MIEPNADDNRETFSRFNCSQGAMRLLIIVSLALAAPLPSQAMAQTPKLAATLIECSTGATAQERSLTVAAAMPAMSTANLMKMRFELYQRLPGTNTTFERVRVPAWVPWVRSLPGVPGLMVQRTVDSLLASAKYKVLVRFRWYDADGKRVKARLRTSKICRQDAPPTVAAPGA